MVPPNPGRSREQAGQTREKGGLDKPRSLAALALRGAGRAATLGRREAGLRTPWRSPDAPRPRRGVAALVWTRPRRLGPLRATPTDRRLSVEVGEAVRFSAAAPGAL